MDGQDLSHQNHGRGWLGKAGGFFVEDVNGTVDASEIPRSPVEVGRIFPLFSGDFSTIPR